MKRKISGQVLASAQSLSKESCHLKLEVDKFMRTIRTGPADRRLHEDPDYPGPERRHDHMDVALEDAPLESAA